MRISKYSTGLEGKRFNRTTIKTYAYSISEGRSGHRHYWIFLCDCGTWHISDARSAHRGMVQSCGCLNRDGTQKSGFKHGHTSHSTTTREFNSWKKLKARCYDPRNEWFHRYGGRGIRVCQLLRDSFTAFLDLLGPRPQNKTVDRINNDGHYSCGKCHECRLNQWSMNIRWATIDEQNSNKHNTRLITFNGKTQAMFLWAREFEISSALLCYRVKSKSVDEVFTALSDSHSP